VSEIVSEKERGCGWRKVGGAYLVGTGLAVPCDALPLELVDCPCCGFEVPFSRNIIKIHGGYLAGRMRGHECRDKFPCPICHGSDKIKRFYLMYVSQKAYTPDTFMSEAMSQGVSKRIPPQSIPKDLKLGEDWIFLAMKKYPLKETNKPPLIHPDAFSTEEPETKIREAKAVFYAFKPIRKEIMLWSDTPNTVIDHWKEQGFTPVFIDHTPENEAKHGVEEDE
jgi:hypothetical protein